MAQMKKGTPAAMMMAMMALAALVASWRWPVVPISQLHAHAMICGLLVLGGAVPGPGITETAF